MKLFFPAVLMVLLVGCGTASRTVSLNMGPSGTLILTPRSGGGPVALNGHEFETAMAKLARRVRPSPRPQEAAQRLFDVETRSGSYTYEASSRRLTPLAPGAHLKEQASKAEVELTRDYMHWCERTGRPGDCLRLLTGSRTLDSDGRLALCMALAKASVLDEMSEAFRDMADPQAMAAAVLWTWTTYMVLITVPEPVSKGIAAVMTATLIAYVGIDTFWSLIVGFRHLMDEADRATTFSALREAGERYGQVMGRNAARAFAMVAMAAIGSPAPALAARVPKLPSATLAAAQAETQMGIRLAAVGEVKAAALSAGSLTLTLAPGAVAMTANSQGSRRFSKADRDAAYEKSQDAAGRARCEYCDEELTREPGRSDTYEADHRQPYSKGGPSSGDNLAPSCRTCNREKGAQDLDTDWIPPKNR
ncbi:HNH endonuclease [Stigmatella aurantiaca]|uniref:HNH endonuclease n=1 Tax=Stigmatella aurantiaca TaxID=41 RepID=A0A1H7ZIE7_STIAU|nr:HNH endonuclease signature motif containing protein [Stigmatella aurantiaca]SEM58043.1 HNH endonuclease [Stigmatella aurantiaca]